MNLLTKDLSNVDISRPLLEKGLTRFEVAEVKVEKSKDGLKDLLVFTFKTVFKAKSRPNKDGVVTDINPGFTIIDRLTITTSEKRDESLIEKDLAQRQVEILGVQKREGFLPLEQYLHKHVDALVDIEVDKEGKYGDQNRLRKIQPAK